MGELFDLPFQQLGSPTHTAELSLVGGGETAQSWELQSPSPSEDLAQEGEEVSAPLLQAHWLHLQ